MAVGIGKEYGNKHIGATVLENVATVPSAPSKVMSANVDNQDLEQLLLTQRPSGTGNPHQNAADNSAKLS